MATRKVPSEYSVDIVVSGLELLKKEKLKELDTFGCLLCDTDRNEIMKYIEDINKTKVYILELMVDSLQQQRS